MCEAGDTEWQQPMFLPRNGHILEVMWKLASLLVLVSACGEVVQQVDVTISPAAPVTTDDLVATIENGDGRKLAVEWSNNGAAGPTGNTVTADLTTKGDVWKVQVFDQDLLVGSAEVTVANSPTILTSPSIKGPTVAGAAQVCDTAVMDADEEPLTLTIAWELGGAPYTGTTTMTKNPGDTIPVLATHAGEMYKCSVTAKPNDESTPPQTQSASILITQRLAYTISEPTAPTLQIIDLDTGVLTTVGPLNVAYNFGDLAWDRANQRLYMVDGRGAKSLYTVNTTTGAATLVGAHNLNDMFSIGFAPTGLYGVAFGSQNQLYKLDPTTGQPTLVGDLAVTGGRVEGLVFDSKRNLMIGQTNSGGFYTIDVANAAATALGGNTSMNDFGLTYDPYVDRYVTLDYNQNLQSFDPTTYVPTLVKAGLSNRTSIAIPLPPP